MRTGFRGFGVAAAVAVLAVVACHKIKIATPGDGTVLTLGQSVTFHADVDGADASKTRWLVNGAHVATGRTYATSSLPIGVHEIVAESDSKHGRRERDRIEVEVVGWRAVASPARAPVRAIARDAGRNQTWLAVPGEGAWRIDAAGRAAQFAAGAGLPSNDVRAVALRGPDVWFATDRGVARFDGSTWTTFGAAAQGLPSDDVRALAVDPTDLRLWAATPAGIGIFDGNGWSRIAHPAPGAASLAVRGGTAYLGTDAGGLQRSAGGGAFAKLDGDAAIDRDRLFALAVDTGGPRRCWIAGAAEGVAKFRDGAWERFNPDGPPPLGTAAMAGEASGALWIAEAGGPPLVVRRRAPNGRWRRFEAPASLGAQAPWRAIAVDAVSGEKWIAADGTIVVLGAAGAAAGARDLPDLKTQPPYQLAIGLNSTTNKRELRLSNAVQNMGDGPLHVEGRVDAATGTTFAIQHLFRGDQDKEQFHAGTFTFASHASHNHMHVDNFATYQLREVLAGGAVGEILRQSAKVTFCLMDLSHISGGPSSGVYGCDPHLQGVSKGWADIYASGLDGQDIDIDGIGPGEYWVVSTAATFFAEKDYANNTALTRVRIDANDNVTVLEEVWGAR